MKMEKYVLLLIQIICSEKEHYPFGVISMLYLIIAIAHL